MKKQLIIFGAGEIAQLAHYYFETDSEYQVSAFAVDSQYIKNTSLNNKPIVDFGNIAEKYPPDSHDFFVALSYSKLNSIRKEKFLLAKAMGYSIASYISSRATILSGEKFGDNCFILEDNTIQPFVKIGNNVTLWSGNHIGHHSTIGDHTFIASHVVISGGVNIGEQCFIGVNATMRDHIKIGDRCIIGAGCLLLENAEPDGIYADEGSKRSKVPSYRLKNI